MPESITGKELEVSQQLFNIDSTTIQHTSLVDLTENVSSLDEVRDTAAKEFIQQTTKDEGEREVVEQIQSEEILQTEQIANSSTTQKDISSQQTKSLDSTSGQEAFQQKYQPVEVLNYDGDWVSGYYVHKCIMVANLESIDRKWALYDERGAKYVVWGEIRLPRVG